MKNWNIHSTWIIGILLAILIGSTSVDWNAIKDLPGIISFAVGLSSLILAVIAIFQTLSSTGSVEASLAAVREATEGSARVSGELAASASIIQQAATDAQAAASSAMAATGNFASISTTIIESNEAGAAAVTKLLEEISAKGSESPPQSTNKQRQAVNFPAQGSMGGSAVTYAAIRGFEEQKPFTFRKIFPEDTSTSWEQGYLSCLADTGYLSLTRFDGYYLVNSINIDDLIAEKQRLKSKVYARVPEGGYVERIALVDAFFGPDKGQVGTTDARRNDQAPNSGPSQSG